MLKQSYKWQDSHIQSYTKYDELWCQKIMVLFTVLFTLPSINSTDKGSGAALNKKAAAATLVRIIFMRKNSWEKMLTFRSQPPPGLLVWSLALNVIRLHLFLFWEPDDILSTRYFCQLNIALGLIDLLTYQYKWKIFCILHTFWT